MPYSINTNSMFIIDGDELNAGDRAFVRDMRHLVIDGELVGSAGLRQFAKDHSIKMIEAGISTRTRLDVITMSFIAVTGDPRGADIYAHPVAHIIDGLPASHSSAPVALRSTNTIIIDNVPQEPAP